MANLKDIVKTSILAAGLVAFSSESCAQGVTDSKAYYSSSATFKFTENRYVPNLTKLITTNKMTILDKSLENTTLKDTSTDQNSYSLDKIVFPSSISDNKIFTIKLGSIDALMQPNPFNNITFGEPNKASFDYVFQPTTPANDAYNVIHMNDVVSIYYNSSALHIPEPSPLILSALGAATVLAASRLRRRNQINNKESYKNDKDTK